MIRGLVIFFSLVFIAAVGTWTQILRRENARLEKRNREFAEKMRQFKESEPPPVVPTPAPATDRARLQAELDAEKQRLAVLEERLHMTEQPQKNDRAHALQEIERLRPQIKDAENQITNLSEDSRVVNQRSQNYRQQQHASAQQTKESLHQQATSLQNQIEDIRQQIKETRATRAAPYRKQALVDLQQQVEVLHNQRDLILRQIKQVEQGQNQASKNITSEVVTEQNEVRRERAAATAQLGELKKQLQHWQAVRDVNTSPEYLKQLHEDVAQSKARVQSLSSQLGVTP